MTQAPAEKPLANLRILVTRPRTQSAELVERIETLGGKAILLPAIEIVPVGGSALKEALSSIDQFDWLVLTSVNGVAAVAAIRDSIPATVKIAAIGPATSSEIEKRFRKPDVVPKEFISDAIAPAMGDVKGKKILLARANIARKGLAIELQRLGAHVTDVAAYSIRRPSLPEHVDQPDFITVTSSSAVRHTLENLQELGRASWRETIGWICIGPITADTALELGCKVAEVADVYTTDGLVWALLTAVNT